MQMQMIMHKAEKYALDAHCLTDEQKTFLLQNFGCARKVYNLFVDNLYTQLESFLYNVLSQYQDYYAENSKTLNRALYTNTALYTPDVTFEHNGVPVPFDVLTCASPNFGTAARNYGATKAENSVALRSRICFVLDILNVQGVNTAILGAFGCGVFCQDGTEVARLFREEAARTVWQVPVKLVYAIIDSARGGNYQQFAGVFSI